MLIASVIVAVQSILRSLVPKHSAACITYNIPQIDQHFGDARECFFKSLFIYVLSAMVATCGILRSSNEQKQFPRVSSIHVP